MKSANPRDRRKTMLWRSQGSRKCADKGTEKRHDCAYSTMSSMYKGGRGATPCHVILTQRREHAANSTHHTHSHRGPQVEGTPPRLVHVLLCFAHAPLLTFQPESWMQDGPWMQDGLQLLRPQTQQGAQNSRKEVVTTHTVNGFLLAFVGSALVCRILWVYKPGKQNKYHLSPFPCPPPPNRETGFPDLCEKLAQQI